MTTSTTKQPAEITVLYFAAASTATGLTSERVTLPVNEHEPEPSSIESSIPHHHHPSSTIREGFPLLSLADLLASRHPHTQLKTILAGSEWAVDEEMVDEPDRVYLKGGEEVAVICPVSGG